MSIHSFFLCSNLQGQIYIFHSVMMNKSQLKSQRGGEPTVWKRETCLHFPVKKCVYMVQSVCLCAHAFNSICLWLVCLIDNRAVERKTDKDTAGLWPRLTMLCEYHCSQSKQGELLSTRHSKYRKMFPQKHDKSESLYTHPVGLNHNHMPSIFQCGVGNLRGPKLNQIGEKKNTWDPFWKSMHMINHPTWEIFFISHFLRTC